MAERREYRVMARTHPHGNVEQIEEGLTFLGATKALEYASQWLSHVWIEERTVSDWKRAAL